MTTAQKNVYKVIISVTNGNESLDSPTFDSDFWQ